MLGRIRPAVKSVSTAAGEPWKHTHAHDTVTVIYEDVTRSAFPKEGVYVYVRACVRGKEGEGEEESVCVCVCVCVCVARACVPVCMGLSLGRVCTYIISP